MWKIVVRVLLLIPGVFLILGFSAFGNNYLGVEENDSIKRSEIKLNGQAWRIGANYTYLPLPKLDEGTIRYGILEFSLDYEIRPKLWLGTGLGMAYWEYHKRTVTRTIDQISIDPQTNNFTYTFIDSISGFTNKFNFVSIPARIRLDLISRKNQTVFISSGASFNIAFRELEGREDNSSSSKSIGSPDSFTHNTFGVLNLGYEFSQFKGISSTVSLQYRRTLYSKGIPEEGNNYFGFKVGVSFVRGS